MLGARVLGLLILFTLLIASQTGRRFSRFLPILAPRFVSPLRRRPPLTGWIRNQPEVQALWCSPRALCIRTWGREMGFLLPLILQTPCLIPVLGGAGAGRDDLTGSQHFLNAL